MSRNPGTRPTTQRDEKGHEAFYGAIIRYDNDKRRPEWADQKPGESRWLPLKPPGVKR